MNKQSNAEYYAARLEAEREAIEQAGSDEARAAHRALADHYLRLLGEPVHPAGEAPSPTTPAETHPRA